MKPRQLTAVFLIFSLMNLMPAVLGALRVAEARSAIQPNNLLKRGVRSLIVGLIGLAIGSRLHVVEGVRPAVDLEPRREMKHCVHECACTCECVHAGVVVSVLCTLRRSPEDCHLWWPIPFCKIGKIFNGLDDNVSRQSSCL